MLHSLDNVGPHKNQLNQPSKSFPPNSFDNVHPSKKHKVGAVENQERYQQLYGQVVKTRPTKVLLWTWVFFFAAELEFSESSSAIISHFMTSSYHLPSRSRAYCMSSIGSQDSADSQVRSALCRGTRSPEMLRDSFPMRATLPSDAWTTERSSVNGIGSWKAPPVCAYFGGHWDIMIYRSLQKADQHDSWEININQH